MLTKKNDTLLDLPVSSLFNHYLMLIPSVPLSVVTIYDPNQSGYQKLMQQAEKNTSALQANVQQDTDELTALTKKYDDLTTAKAAADKQVEALTTQVETLTAQGKKDSDEILGLRKKVANLEGQVKSITVENEMVENQVKELQSQNKKDRDAIAALTAQGKKDRDEIVAMAMAKAEVIDGRFLKQQQLEEEVQRNKAEIASLHHHLDEAEKRLDEQVAENSRLNAALNSIAKLETEATLEEERVLSDLESRHVVDQTEIEELKRKLETALAETAGSQRTIQALQAQIQADKTTIAKMTTAIDDLDLASREQLAAFNRQQAETTSIKSQVALLTEAHSSEQQMYATRLEELEKELSLNKAALRDAEAAQSRLSVNVR